MGAYVMDEKSYFEIDEESDWQIVEEIIDGEVIIINLDKGHYFSLNGTGAEVWSYLRSGMSGNNIISSLKHHFDDREVLKQIFNELYN